MPGVEEHKEEGTEVQGNMNLQEESGVLSQEEFDAMFGDEIGEEDVVIPSEGDDRIWDPSDGTFLTDKDYLNWDLGFTHSHVDNLGVTSWETMFAYCGKLNNKERILKLMRDVVIRNYLKDKVHSRKSIYFN